MIGIQKISAPNRHSRTGGNPAPGNVRLCPQKAKSAPRAAIYQIVCQPRKGRFQRLRTRPQRTACRRPVWRQRSEMSGNEREHEISAPNRHSRTGGNPVPANVLLYPQKQNPAPGPPSAKPCASLIRTGFNPSVPGPSEQPVPTFMEATLGNERK